MVEDWWFGLYLANQGIFFWYTEDTVENGLALILGYFRGLKFKGGLLHFSFVGNLGSSLYNCFHSKFGYSFV